MRLFQVDLPKFMGMVKFLGSERAVPDEDTPRHKQWSMRGPPTEVR